SHVPRELDTQMPKTTDALHPDQISAAQAGIAKSVVSRNARAEERSGFYGRELIRNGSDAARFRDHHCRIYSIRVYSRYTRFRTIHNVSASARLAPSVLAADQADTDALTDFPSRHSAAQGFNATNHFMSGNARQSQTRVSAHDRGRIRVTDSACFHPNPNLTCSRLRDWPFHHSKPAGLIYCYCFVFVSHLNLLL